VGRGGLGGTVFGGTDGYLGASLSPVIVTQC
jgi:hypothetical protein